MNINPRLKLALIRTYSKDNGFAIVLSTFAGLSMLIAATSMILRAHQNEVNAFTQNQSAASLAMTELGVTQTLHMLNENPILAGKNNSDDVWKNLSSLSSGTDCTGGSSTASSGDIEKAEKANKSNKDDRWINVKNGKYRVLSYTVASNTGTLEVEGQSQNDAATVVQVTVALGPPTFPVPGLWADNSTPDPLKVSFGTESIHAVVCIKGNSYNSAQIDGTTIDPTPLYNGITPGIFTDLGSLPTPPTAPGTAITLPAWKSGYSDCFLMLPRIPDDDREDQTLRVDSLSGTKCSNFNDVTSDTPNADGVYVYIIDDDGGDSIDVSNSQFFVNPRSGERVEIYLNGRLKLQGSSNPGTGLDLTCKEDNGSDYTVNTFINYGDPSKLAIYGSNNTDEVYIAQTIIRAFMYIPNGIVKTSEGQIQGAVWAKQFDISNSGSACNIAVEQQDVGLAASNISSAQGANISAPNTWIRKDIPLPTGSDDEDEDD